VTGLDDLEELALLLDKDFEGWRSSLSPAEKCDLAYYQAWGFDRINRFLRGAFDPSVTPATLRQVSSAIKNIDSALQRTSMRRSVTVFRGVVDGPATLGVPLSDVTSGIAFGDQAYLSTSLDAAAARTKAGNTPTSLAFKIEVPVGQSAAWFGQLGKKAYRLEYELLLPRQSRLLVLDFDQCSALPTLHVEVMANE
jgi:hypothetical protein